MTTKTKGYVVIENKGEIDINSLKLIGASTKRDDKTKIGFFGSGLKYAIAVLMREQIPLSIYSGESQIKLGTKVEKFRDQEFNVITVNGKPTSMTTEMGIDWKLWFAIRELYCNAIDEGDFKLSITGSIEPQKDKTKIYVPFDAKLDHVFDDWNSYFSDKRNDIFDKVGKDIMFNGSTNLIVYRKGVQVHSENVKSIFHYDMQDIEINESRVIKDFWGFRFQLTNWLCKNASLKMVEAIYSSFSGTFEEDLFWDSFSYCYNQNWLTAVNGRTLIMKDVAGYFVDDFDGNELILPNKMVQGLKKAFGSKITTKGMSLDSTGTRIELAITQDQAKLIEECKDLLFKAGFPITHNIKVVKFTNAKQMGEAYNYEILLSEKVFNYGKRFILETIVEEYAHLDSGAGDKTRSFQNYLLNLFINSIEKKLNITI